MDHRIPYEEANLAPLLKQKNIKAFDQLYDKYAPALYSVILQIVKDEATANDVLKKVFLQVWHKIESYDASKFRLFTWVMNIARCTAIEEVSMDNQDSEPGQHEFPSEELSERVIRSSFDSFGLKKVLHQLGDDEKLLLELCYYRGLSFQQVASKMDIPEGNLKTRIKSALRQLRTLF